MSRRSILLMAALLTLPWSAGAQEVAHDQVLEARVWLDRGSEPVLEQGDRVRIYYRTSFDAYAAIFQINTDGRVRLVFPARPGANPVVGGGRDYRLLVGGGAQWVVDEDPGVGTYFMVASERPLDFTPFLGGFGDVWDISRVGGTVYQDPYLAMDDYVAALLPEWEVEPYALDFIQYSVGEQAHDYPRYLCYDCHDYQPYSAWNPYEYACAAYRVVVYDDPYFYPDYRYVASRVVFARPIPQRPRFAVTIRKAGEGWSPVVLRREAPPLPRGTVQYKELQAARAAAARSAPRRQVEPRPAAVQQSPDRRATPQAPAAGARGTQATRRGVAAGPLVKATPRAGSQATPTPRRSRAVTSATPTTARPTLERRTGSPAAARPTPRATNATPRAAPSARATPSRRVGPSRSSARPTAGSTSTGRSTRVTTPRRATTPTRVTTPRSAPTTSRARPSTSRATPPRVGRRPTAAPRTRPTLSRSTGSSSRPSAGSSKPRPRATPARRPAGKPKAAPRPARPVRRGGGAP